MKHEGDCDCNFNWRARNDLQKVTGRVRNRRTRRDHLNDDIIEIGQKTGKSSGDLRILAVSQTAVKIHQLMLVWKTNKE